MSQYNPSASSEPCFIDDAFYVRTNPSTDQLTGEKQFNNAGTSNDYTMVYIDTDNDSGTEMSIKLMGLHNLTASDFIL